MNHRKNLGYVCAELYYALKPHRWWLLLQVVSLVGLIGLNAHHGEIKSWAQLDWVDIVGEGATALLIVCWLIIILSVRAKGWLTDLFACGLIAMVLALSQDLLDEFFQLESGIRWDSWLESMPVGFLLLTAALWFWRAEQQQISRYLSRRKLLSPAPTAIDGGLNIPGFEYLQQQLLQRAKQPKTWLNNQLLLLEVADFNALSRCYGGSAADKLLMTITELLLLALPPDALLCRYAGQRFAILLNHSPPQAAILSQQLSTLLQHFCFRNQQNQAIHPSFHWVKVSAELADSPQQAVQQLLEQANQQLTILKQASHGEVLAN
ncbi:MULTISPECIES: diguanylate cyclase domain-containing protein [unclassified Agarivorans]|uniref:diguanylate cyclase domain-containing protein n=1 Tax=unclassified Agarivorans TaxID=2636026 RepID=UPI003D7E42B5